jgi:UDP-2,3-diacylglucosamine pyrophosphatase LpxH
VKTVRTVILSDCHIGSPEADRSAIKRFLAHLVCDRLILLGDFWDLWDMSAKEIRKQNGDIVEIIERVKGRGTKIIYVLGNHDDTYWDDPIFSKDVVDVVPSISICCGFRNISFIHGHEFDHCYQNARWFTKLAAWVNRQSRKFIGISAKSFMRRPTCTDLRGTPDFEPVTNAVHEAAMEDCWGKGFNALVMGHTHRPMHLENTIQGIEFMNAGDWKWSNTYAEIKDGRMSLHAFK